MTPKATHEELQELFNITLAFFLDHLKKHEEGVKPLRASMLREIRQFLKDNKMDIEAIRAAEYEVSQIMMPFKYENESDTAVLNESHINHLKFKDA